MKKLTENNRLESLAFCALIFLFAIQPVFGRIGVADDVVWVLMAVCIAVALFGFVRALFGFVRHVRTEGAAYINRLYSKDPCSYFSTACCLLGLVISYCLNTQLVAFWIVLSILDITTYLIPEHAIQK